MKLTLTSLLIFFTGIVCHAQETNPIDPVDNTKPIISGEADMVLKKVDNKVQLKWLIEAYKLFPKKDSFFILPKSGKMEESSFVKLAGNNELWQQIKAGQTEKEIRKSWEPALAEFKKTRKKYLMYADFE